MELLVETSESRGSARLLESVLSAYPVAISIVGRPGDVRWVRRLWRHV
jgi:hypothetical protein